MGNHLGVYQIHSVTPDSPVLDDAAVTGALNELRATGVRIGLTTSGPEQANVIRRALELAVDGTLLFATVQATWNLLERSAGPALDEAHDAGLGVIVKEALANGRLAGSDDRADAAHLGVGRPTPSLWRRPRLSRGRTWSSAVRPRSTNCGPTCRPAR